MITNQNIRYYIRLLSIFVLATSCSNKKLNITSLELDSRYTKIKNIHAIADCKGPYGRYTTEVKTLNTGDILFNQEYSYDGTSYFAKIVEDSLGYDLNPEGDIIDTLSLESIEMIRSHFFHRLNTKPEYFFHNIEHHKSMTNDLEIYTAVDRLNYPATILYNKIKKIVMKFDLLNPIDTTERIEIINKSWIDSDYGDMVKELIIIQAEKDTFEFNFSKINISD